MKYSLDKMHEDKSIWERRNGKTVDAIVDVIGKLMVTDYETIPLVVLYADRVNFMTPIFIDLCVNHFKEQPIIKRQYEWMIHGYNSRIIIFSDAEWRTKYLGYRIEPTFD